MKRLHKIIAVALVVAIGAAVTIVVLLAVAARGSRQPNVILIVVDTLRADHLSQYGFDLRTSPGLDEFASHSTRFENCHTSAPWTRPALTTLFTGMHPVRHSVTRKSSLKDTAVTLAERLREAGLQTVGISFNPDVCEVTGLAQGFDIFVEEFGNRTTAYSDISRMLELAKMWFRGRADRRDPFMLFLLLMRDIMKRGKAEERRAEVTPEMLVSLHEKYATAVRYSTDSIGEFFEFLRRRGHYDESLIILTADHGEELYDHRGFSHGYTLYDEVLHVPLFIKTPQQEKARVVQQQVQLQDVYPTILDLLGEAVPAQVDGRSLAPLLAHDEPAAAVGDKILEVDWEKRCVARGILRWPWKLIRVEHNYEGLEQADLLFNIEDDPAESKNMSEQRPDLVRKLAEDLRRSVSELDSGEDFAVHRELSSELEAQLETLGYVP